MTASCVVIHCDQCDASFVTLSCQAYIRLGAATVLTEPSSERSVLLEGANVLYLLQCLLLSSLLTLRFGGRSPFEVAIAVFLRDNRDGPGGGDAGDWRTILGALDPVAPAGHGTCTVHALHGVTSACTGIRARL